MIKKQNNGGIEKKKNPETFTSWQFMSSKNMQGGFYNHGSLAILNFKYDLKNTLNQL